MRPALPRAANPFAAAAPRRSSPRSSPWRVGLTHYATESRANAKPLGDNGTAKHPLADPTMSDALKTRADEIRQAFAAIEPILKELAPRQFAEGFATAALAELQERLGVIVPLDSLQASWLAPLDMRRLYALCVLLTFCRLMERRQDRDLTHIVDGESADELIQHWGFHSIDITSCADGRMSGVIDFILRVPPAIVAFRKSYAGALFEVEESLRHWESIELGRWREGRPNAAEAPTRYLKIGVYHFSSADPEHEGCAAHGSDGARAAGAVLERLRQFSEAVQLTQCCDVRVATLLVGVDTDTDAIRVHVPDAGGEMSIDRLIDNRLLYERTRSLTREKAKEAIRDEVADCMGVTAEDAPTTGMRWFCGYLLKNNLAQVDAVRQWHGGGYADRGHTEQLIVVGAAVDDVQLRNLAFQAQMDTAEEGAADLEVGVRILKSHHERRGLPVPILVHYCFDPRIPGGRARAERRALRLRTAIEARFAALVGRGELHVLAVVRAADSGTLFAVERAARHCGESEARG